MVRFFLRSVYIHTYARTHTYGNNMSVDRILGWAYANPFQDGTIMQSNKQLCSVALNGSVCGISQE